MRYILIIALFLISCNKQIKDVIYVESLFHSSQLEVKGKFRANIKYKKLQKHNHRPLRRIEKVNRNYYIDIFENDILKDNDLHKLK